MQAQTQALVPDQHLLQILQWVQTAVMAAAAIIVGMIYRGYLTGRWVQQRDDHITELRSKVREVEQRLLHGNQRMSSLSSDVQKMPEVLRRIFLTADLFEEVSERWTEDRRDLRRNIEQLWAEIRRLERRNG